MENYKVNLFLINVTLRNEALEKDRNLYEEITVFRL